MEKNTQASKAELRRRMQALRKTLTTSEKAEKSQEIACKVSQLEAFQEARTLLVYCALPEEVQTGAIVDSARQADKRVCVPLLIDSEADLQVVDWPVDDNQWVKGPFGISQPRVETAKRVEVDQLDLILAPGLAFDAGGGRLGYGKGYFDRLFADIRPDCFKFGLAFDFQVIDEVPMDSEDKRLHGVITDKKLYPAPPQ